jgi:hypothetical protein
MENSQQKSFVNSLNVTLLCHFLSLGASDEHRLRSLTFTSRETICNKRTTDCKTISTFLLLFLLFETLSTLSNSSLQPPSALPTLSHSSVPFALANLIETRKLGEHQRKRKQSHKKRNLDFANKATSKPALPRSTIEHKSRYESPSIPFLLFLLPSFHLVRAAWIP